MRTATDGNDELIRRALAIEGRHLYVGHNGYTLYFGDGCNLSGYRPETIKAACLVSGLPVIDCRAVPFDAVWAIETRGPMTAVGRAADPQPWHALASAPLDYVAELYRAAGAEVANMPACTVPA